MKTLFNTHSPRTGIRLAALSLGALTLSACAYTGGTGYYDDGYGYAGNDYYCDPYDPYDAYYSCDYRSGFGQMGYSGGYYDNFYYPGFGIYLYDRPNGRRYAMRDNHRRYWAQQRYRWQQENRRDRRYDRRVDRRDDRRAERREDRRDDRRSERRGDRRDDSRSERRDRNDDDNTWQNRRFRSNDATQPQTQQRRQERDERQNRRPSAQQRQNVAPTVAPVARPSSQAQPVPQAQPVAAAPPVVQRQRSATSRTEIRRATAQGRLRGNQRTESSE